MSNPFFGKDILTTKDFTKAELDKVLDLAYKLKAKGIASRSLELLKGKTLLLLFFRPSTRTRTSFTAAMQQMGGFVQIPDPSDMRLTLEDKPGAGEWLKDTARVVERYVDAVGIRLLIPMPDKNGVLMPGGGDAVLKRFADYARIPIINLASCTEHPTQSLADIMVMQENLGDLKRKKIVMMWAYSPIMRSWSSVLAEGLIAAKYGMDVSFAYPEGYDMDPAVMSEIEKDCKTAGGKFEISHNYKKALEGADVVFPRQWWSPRYYINTKEEEQRLSAKHKDWKLTDSLLKLTNNARFIHVMPFDRGNEVDDSVADGPNSVVDDQAENLLHIRKAFLSMVMADEKQLKTL